MAVSIDQIRESALTFSMKYYKALRDQCIRQALRDLEQSKFKMIAPMNAFMLTSILAYGATDESTTQTLYLEKAGFSEKIELERAKTAYLGVWLLLEDCGFTLSTEVAHTSKNKPIDGFKWAQENLRVSYKEVAAIAGEENVVSIHSKLTFRPIWKYPFDVNNTKSMKFHQDGAETIMVSVMVRKGLYHVDYLNDFNAKFVEIPLQHNFGNYKFTMFIIVMNNNCPNDAHTFLHEISKMDMNKIFLKSWSRTEITLYLPKLKAESMMCRVYCDELLERGAPYTCTDAAHCDDLVFPTGTSEFGSMFSGAPSIKTFVSASALINETGTVDSTETRKRRATTGTPVIGRVPHDTEAEPFKVNRPYMMVIAARNIWASEDVVPVFTIQITGRELEKSFVSKGHPAPGKPKKSGFCVVI
ncbi:uncharacterized protein [Venturia canescens]|nr:uncharacterized protein LOC122418170 isoform X2 [Venturia canescens]